MSRRVALSLMIVMLAASILDPGRSWLRGAFLERSAVGVVPAVRGNAARTGELLGSIPVGTPVATWLSRPSSGLSDPVLAGGILLIGGTDGLFAIDMTNGEERWQLSIGEEVSGPAVEDGVVYAGSASGIVYAVDVRTGELRWQTAVDTPVTHAPAVDGTTVVIGGGGPGRRTGSVIAIDRASGVVKWRFALPQDDRLDDFVGSVLTMATDGVYVGTLGGQAYAIDLASGTERWRFTSDLPGTMSAPMAVVNNMLFLGVTQPDIANDRLYAIDTTNGRPVWSVDKVGGSSPPAVVGGTVYVGGDEGFLSAMDATTGTLRWRVDFGDFTSSAPMVAQGTVFAVDVDGSLHAIEAATGTEQWRIAIGAALGASPIIGDGLMFIRTAAGIQSGSGSS